MSLSFIILFSTTENPDVEHRKSQLKLIIAKLPRVNRDVLYYLLSFLNDLSTHKEKTKMGVSNLGMSVHYCVYTKKYLTFVIATCWAPNLLREPPSEEQSMQQMIADRYYNNNKNNNNKNNNNNIHPFFL